MARVPLVVVQPTKKISEMTDAELRAFAEELAHLAVTAHRSKQ